MKHTVTETRGRCAIRAKGFDRGLELFGQQASRVKEPGYRESIARHGILVVEGYNDVIGLDNLGIPALAIMSNRITEHQIEKLARCAKQLANGKVSILFDCEQTADDGAKEAVWVFMARGLDVRLGWSQAMHGGAFKGRQRDILRFIGNLGAGVIEVVGVGRRGVPPLGFF